MFSFSIYHVSESAGGVVHEKLPSGVRNTNCRPTVDPSEAGKPLNTKVADQSAIIMTANNPILSESSRGTRCGDRRQPALQFALNIEGPDVLSCRSYRWHSVNLVCALPN